MVSSEFGQENISGSNTDIDLFSQRKKTDSMFGQDNRTLNENLFPNTEVINDSDFPLNQELDEFNNSSSHNTSNTVISNASTDSSRPFSVVTKQSSNFTFKLDEMFDVSDFKFNDTTEVSLTSKIISSAYVLPMTASSLSMTGSAIVVMIAIVWPFHNISKQSTMIAIILIWLVSLSISVFSFMYIYKDDAGIIREKMDQVQVLLFMFTCLTALLIASIYVIVVVVAFHMCCKSIAAAAERRKSKAMITICLIIGSYCLCYIPFLLYYIGTYRYYNLPVALSVAGTVAPLLFVIHTCIDPIVYSFRVLEVKKFITKIVKRFSF